MIIPAVVIAMVVVSVAVSSALAAYNQNRAKRRCQEALRRIVLESQSSDSYDGEQCAAQQVKIAGW